MARKKFLDKYTPKCPDQQIKLSTGSLFPSIFPGWDTNIFVPFITRVADQEKKKTQLLACSSLKERDAKIARAKKHSSIIVVMIHLQ